MKITTLGIDIARNVFEAHGVDDRGRPVLRCRVSRKQLLTSLANLGPCLIGMEACGGKSRLLGISKCGDRYQRTLLIHGDGDEYRHMS